MYSVGGLNSVCGFLVESPTDPTRSRRVAIASTWCVPGGAYRGGQVIGGSTRAAYSVESYANPSEWLLV
jgi:hypothetical protein